MAECPEEHCAVGQYVQGNIVLHVGQYVQGDIVHGGNLTLKTKTEINLCKDISMCQLISFKYKKQHVISPSQNEDISCPSMRIPCFMWCSC